MKMTGTTPEAAEDVYYIPRDGGTAIGLNQLMEVPAQLTEVELTAIDIMCRRSATTMRSRLGGVTMPPLRGHGSIRNLAHGLYYVDPAGGVYVISQDGFRPDLIGPAMDFAVATVESGCDNLQRLRGERERLGEDLV
jgi:hypothetical protein